MPSEKRQGMGECRSESGQWRLSVINVQEGLAVVQESRKSGSTIGLRGKFWRAWAVFRGSELHTPIFE